MSADWDRPATPTSLEPSRFKWGVTVDDANANEVPTQPYDVFAAHSAVYAAQSSSSERDTDPAEASQHASNNGVQGKGKEPFQKADSKEDDIAEDEFGKRTGSPTPSEFTMEY